MTIDWIKETANGNWWLIFGGEQIGFWPGKFFKQSTADKVEWGGEVFSASMPSPEMGNGHLPDKHPDFDAVIFNRTLFDENDKMDEWVSDTEIFTDASSYGKYPNGYNVIDGKDMTYSDFPVRHMIYYGGPGNIV